VNQLENDIRTKNEQLSKFSTNPQPQTMKEWQMYRSIASRMEKNTDPNITTNDSTSNTDRSSDRDDLISQQLQLWKEYIVKEEGHRKQSGLTRGPKLPFPWQESVLGVEKNNRYDDESLSPLTNDKASRIEIRKKVNRMSIEAMESLLLKTDPTRREKLQKEIDYLKATLEANDYLDIDESTFDDANDHQQQIRKDGSVDTTNLFTSSKDWDNDLMAWDTSSTSQQDTVTLQSVSSPLAPSYDNLDDDVIARPIPPPKTAFFSDDGEYDLGETLTGDSRLGTMEEQKLEAMFRRAGAKTPEERKIIREQWEEFQQLEQNKRQQLSGIGDDVTAAVGSTADLKYNIADVMREDGDFDAATILATIGPRPVRKKKDTSGVSVENDSSSDEIPTSSTIKQEDVIDSLFRSVSAVGGGRFKDDPVAKEQERSSFEEFVLKESRMRASLDDPSLVSRTTINDLQLPEPTDDTNYAKEVLSSIGPRPSRKSKRAQPINAREYSDRGGVLALDSEQNEEDDDDEDDDNGEDDANEATSTMKNVEFDLVPEWLRKENEETKKGTVVSSSLSGNDFDAVFDNDKYEHNMRQLAEYEKRRKGQTRSMGIDITDVLGRRDSDDYADFKYDDNFLRSRQNDDWGYGTFAKRKANLLDYIELDVQEINALMDHKDSVYSTGVSQYLPRINKPFKEFGAIFRLEGVIVDVDGLQLQAWTKVAEEFGLKQPMIEDVKLAAVIRPETAVKDIFAWSDDFLECRSIAAAHRRTFRQVFETWAKGEGITIPDYHVNESSQQSYSISSGNRQSEAHPIDNRTSMNEKEILKQTGKAWSITATDYGKPPPDHTAILIASTLSPDIAVLKVFKWSSDPIEIEKIARSYILNLLPEAERQAAVKSETLNTLKTDSVKKPRTQTEMMELHYKAWSDVSQKYGFDPPTTDEVLAAFVINEPEIAARGFGWSDDPKLHSDIAKDFVEKLKIHLNGFDIPYPVVVNDPAPTSIQHSETNEAMRDELFQIAFDAWTETARIHDFPPPDVDQVQFALSVGPEEAIVTGFEWTTNPAEIVRLLRSYRDAIGRIRGTEYKNSVERPKPVQAPSGPSQDDIYRTVFDSWTALANELGYPLPDNEQVQFALSVGAEEAIKNGFGWTNDSAKVAEILGKYKAEIAKRRSLWQNHLTTKPQSKNDTADIPMYKVSPGVSRWVKSLLDVEMQCGVVSYLERDQVDTLLQLAGLNDLITPDKRVSASNGYVTDTDMLLGAALRVERRPDHCVVFDTTPYSSVAAHEVEMQSVCLIGPYPRYELLSADTTAASFDSLSAINIRRLFSERVYDQPLVEVQATDPGRTRPTRTRTRFSDDE
jgi:beta-phosphoglucomutase-like phosphatase (HAD superfamily)